MVALLRNLIKLQVCLASAYAASPCEQQGSLRWLASSRLPSKARGRRGARSVGWLGFLPTSELRGPDGGGSEGRGMAEEVRLKWSFQAGVRSVRAASSAATASASVLGGSVVSPLVSGFLSSDGLAWPALGINKKRRVLINANKRKQAVGQFACSMEANVVVSWLDF